MYPLSVAFVVLVEGLPEEEEEEESTCNDFLVLLFDMEENFVFIGVSDIGDGILV